MRGLLLYIWSLLYLSDKATNSRRAPLVMWAAIACPLLLCALPKPTNDISFLNISSLPSQVNFARASGRTCINSAAALVTLGNNVPCLGYDPVTLASLGLLIEQQSTNDISNNTMVGGVAGSPGVIPNLWGAGSSSTVSGVTRTLSYGTENNIANIAARYVGTPTASGGAQLAFNIVGSFSVTAGQAVSASIYAKIVAGSLTNVSNVYMSINWYNNLSVFVSASTVFLSLQSGPSLSSQRFRLDNAVAPATAVSAQMTFGVSLVNGSPVDITTEVGAPQTEPLAFSTSTILTSAGVATRAQDTASLTIPAPWFNQGGFSLVAEYMTNATLPAGVNGGIVQTNAGSGNNRMAVVYQTNASGPFGEIAGVTVYGPPLVTMSNGVVVKAGISYSPVQVSGAVNGSGFGIVSGGTMAPQTAFTFGQNTGGTVNGSLYIRRVGVFTALPLNMLQRVTR